MSYLWLLWFGEEKSYFLNTSCVLIIIFHWTVLPNLSHIMAYKKKYKICHNTLGQTDETAVVQKRLLRSSGYSRPCLAVLQAEGINIPEGPLVLQTWVGSSTRLQKSDLSLKILQSSLYKTGTHELIVNIPGWLRT